MEIKLKEIAKMVDGKIEGEEDILIKGIKELSNAGEGDIAFLSNPKYVYEAKKTCASAIIVGKNIEGIKKTVIRVKDPYFALMQVIKIFNPRQEMISGGISEKAVLGKNLELGKDVAVGSYAVIEDGVKIGQNSAIFPHCYIGRKTKIGKNGIIYPNVTIEKNVNIGDNVIIHPGTVIGSDGFGFAPKDGKYYKIPQVGGVEIEDDVEIGANVTIDRATLGKTIIGAGTKIDNLVQIAHNVKVGKNCVIVAQTGISGSTKIGNNVTLAGQVGLVGHIEIGDNVIIAAKSGVPNDISKGEIHFGYPARPLREAKKINAIISKLPELYREIKELKKSTAESRKEKEKRGE